MKIVVLDAFTLSPLKEGDTSSSHPSWDGLASLGALTLYDRTAQTELVERVVEAEIIMTNKVPLNRETLSALPKLKGIAVMATGTNIIDLEAAKELGIPVCNVPGYSTASVAQTVFSLLLELCQGTGETGLTVKAGRWSQCPDFCYTIRPWIELAGKTLGVIGFGATGSSVAKIGAAFGMKILLSSRTKKPAFEGAEWTSLDDLFAQSDVISLNCPLTPETENLINRKTLAKMKTGALLINTGRGALVDEDAVAEALKDGKLGGFGADVLSKEPPTDDNPLPDAPNTVITPHIAWASIEARFRLMSELEQNVKALMDGVPRNLV